MPFQRIASTGGRGVRTAGGAATALACAVALAAGSAQAAAAPAQARGAPVDRGLQASAGTISTVAGGVGGPGRATQVSLTTGPDFAEGPVDVWSAGGSFYIADTTSARKVTSGGELTTVAGTGNEFAVGDGGPAVSATLLGAAAVTTDGAGNTIIADDAQGIPYGFRVRVAAARTGMFYGVSMTAGDIYTVAGNGTEGTGGTGVPAAQTELSNPAGVAVDHHGNLVIADSGFSGRFSHGARIRVVAAGSGSFYGQKMVAGDIYTVAGSKKLTGVSGDGGPARQAGLGGNVGRVAVDGAGNLVFADGSTRVRVVAARTGTFYGLSMTAGDIYTVAGTGTTGFSGDGGPATTAELNIPVGVALDAYGNLVIGDMANQRIRVVAVRTGMFYGIAMAAGDIYTVAGDGTTGFSGDGGPAAAASLNFPGGVSVDAAGNLLLDDEGNARIRAVAASSGTFYGIAMTAGDIYTIAGNAFPGAQGSGFARPATTAQLNEPVSVAADGRGGLLLTDTANNRVDVVPGSTGTLFGRAMTAGHMYLVAGTGVPGFSGDGGPGTGAELFSPSAVTADAAGNAVIADETNRRIRVVADSTGTFYGVSMTAGDIYTVAGGGTGGDGGPAVKAKLAPTTVAIDPAGNLVIADGGTRIRVVAVRTGTFYGQAMTAGDIYTVAGDGNGGFSGDGGPATKADLSVFGVAVDGAGNLLIADNSTNRIRVVAVRTGTFYGQAMTAEDIYTVAGDGTQGSLGNGGRATKAELNAPDGVAAGLGGTLVIADTGNDGARVVASQDGTFYGIAMKAGDIYLLAGGRANPGTDGLGDGGPAVAATLNQPMAVAADRAGGLLIADTGDNRIRLVTGT